MHMKKAICYLILFLILISVVGCSPRAQHNDPFYNINENDHPLLRLPLVKPIEAQSEDGKSQWILLSLYGPWVKLPNTQDNPVYFYNIEELEKFAISNGVIMAYSAYVDQKADPYILNNYYHWFVIIPKKKIAEGFHTEEEFRQYIQTLGIQDPNWQTPDEAYKQFKQTGCLDWIPDCK